MGFDGHMLYVVPACTPSSASPTCVPDGTESPEILEDEVPRQMGRWLRTTWPTTRPPRRSVRGLLFCARAHIGFPLGRRDVVCVWCFQTRFNAFKYGTLVNRAPLTSSSKPFLIGVYGCSRRVIEKTRFFFTCRSPLRLRRPAPVRGSSMFCEETSSSRRLGSSRIEEQVRAAAFDALAWSATRTPAAPV